MEEIIELSKDDILTINGGASFAYRAGQVIGLLWDCIDTSPSISNPSSMYTICDWFGL